MMADMSFSFNRKYNPRPATVAICGSGKRELYREGGSCNGNDLYMAQIMFNVQLQITFIVLCTTDSYIQVR